MQQLDPIFDVPFGVMNLQGLMPIQDTIVQAPYFTHDITVKQPLFAHTSYPITVTLDPSYNKDYGILTYKPAVVDRLCEGESYQKIYRKNVRWNFGDGTQVEGYSATHTYKVPGKYTISCTMYDVNRQGIKNGYEVKVIVKHVIPTQLSFVKEESNVESIKCSKIEKIAKVEVSVSNNISRPIDIAAERIYKKEDFHEPTWEDVKDKPYPQLDRYSTFLRCEEEYYNNTENKVYSRQFVPTKVYTPEYEPLYGYFSFSNKKIVFNCYRVMPYGNASKMPDFQMLDPNQSILETDHFVTCKVQDVSITSDLPDTAVYTGQRAFVDIFYKSDFLSKKDVISIHFDSDNIRLYNAIEATENFLNLMPLGLHFAVEGNDFSKNNYSVTLNGFLTSFEDVDKLVQLSLIRNFSFTGKLIPYILSEYNTYYIPKDFSFDDIAIRTTLENDNDSIFNVVDLEEYPYFRDVEFDLKTILHSRITGLPHEIIFNYPLKDFDRMIIPREHFYNQDVERLIKVYTPHPLFDSTPVLKDALYDVFTHKDMLDYILTKGMHFFDDTTHMDTCYVTYLLSRLRMMGQEVFDYSTTFEGVNDLRDLARIMTMSHSQLVGNYIDQEYDIRYNESHKGNNVGDEIYVTDKLYVVMTNKLVGDNRFLKGKIARFVRDGKTYDLKEPTVLIIRDNYTNETRTVTFSGISPRETEEEYGIFYIQDYVEDWMWGLLLPDEVDIKSTGLDDKSLVDKSKVMTSYYSFYLLNTDIGKHYVNNFLDESTITAQVTNVKSWEQKDGHTFDLLQKVIYENGDVMNEKS